MNVEYQRYSIFILERIFNMRIFIGGSNLREISLVIDFYCALPAPAFTWTRNNAIPTNQFNQKFNDTKKH